MLNSLQWWVVSVKTLLLVLSFWPKLNKMSIPWHLRQKGKSKGRFVFWIFELGENKWSLFFFAFGSMAEISPFCHIKNLIEKVIAIFWLGAKIENSKSNSDRADFKSYIPIMINDHRIDFWNQAEHVGVTRSIERNMHTGKLFMGLEPLE